MFVVPGNHDVDRSQHSPGLSAWLEGLQAPDAVRELIQSKSGDWPMFMNRLKAYGAFLERHGYAHLTTDPNRLIYAQIRDVKGLRLGIAGLNSAWTCGRDGEKGKLWLGGDWQVGELMLQLTTAHDARLQTLHPFTRRPEKDIFVPDRSIRPRVRAIDVGEDGTHRSLAAVCDGQLIGTSAAMGAPRDLGVRKDDGTRDLALVRQAQPRSFQNRRQLARLRQRARVRGRIPRRRGRHQRSDL